MNVGVPKVVSHLFQLKFERVVLYGERRQIQLMNQRGDQIGGKFFVLRIVILDLAPGLTLDPLGKHIAHLNRKVISIIQLENPLLQIIWQFLNLSPHRHFD